MAKKNRFVLVVLLAVFLLATTTTLLLGISLNTNSVKIKVYKKDFFEVNQLKHGFLNGRNWSIQVERIIAKKIDSFAFSEQNKKVLHEQISGIMNELVNEVDVLLQAKQEGITDRIKMGVIRFFVDLNQIRKKIPHFADVAIEEIVKSGTRDKVRALVKEKIHELLLKDGTPVISRQEVIWKKYQLNDLASFNQYIQLEIDELEAQQRILGYLLVGIMGSILILWLIIIKLKLRRVYAIAFLFSVLISFVNLVTGINLPILEIDARISTIDLEILNSHVLFNDQVLFYQSKSIIDVSKVLMTQGKLGSILVGVFILLFSVFFPAAKLIAATIYLFAKKKTNQLLRLLAFKSGKWSMTDVMVAAIFMAYIGFQSIINEQLNHITTRTNTTDEVNILTTNRSNLQVGFIVFLAFVLFNLFLSIILKRITQVEEPSIRFAERWKKRRIEKRTNSR